MRNNQVEIKISRFGDAVPSGWGKDTGKDAQIISVYADSNNLYEALSVAFGELIKELRVYEYIPSSGKVSVVNNNDCKWLR